MTAADGTVLAGPSAAADLIAAHRQLWDATGQLPFGQAVAAGQLPGSVWARYRMQYTLLLEHEEKALRTLLGQWRLPRGLTDVLRDLAAGCHDLAASTRRHMAWQPAGICPQEPIPATMAYGWWMRGLASGGTTLEALAMFTAVQGIRVRTWEQIGTAEPARPWAETWTSPAHRGAVSELTAGFDRLANAAPAGGGTEPGDLAGVFRQALLCEINLSRACYANESWGVPA